MARPPKKRSADGREEATTPRRRTVEASARSAVECRVLKDGTRGQLHELLVTRKVTSTEARELLDRCRENPRARRELLKLVPTLWPELLPLRRPSQRRYFYEIGDVEIQVTRSAKRVLEAEDAGRPLPKVRPRDLRWWDAGTPEQSACWQHQGDLLAAVETEAPQCLEAIYRCVPNDEEALLRCARQWGLTADWALEVCRYTSSRGARGAAPGVPLRKRFIRPPLASPARGESNWTKRPRPREMRARKPEHYRWFVWFHVLRKTLKQCVEDEARRGNSTTVAVTKDTIRMALDSVAEAVGLELRKDSQLRSTNRS